jgi:hypothetical protein
MNWDKIKKTFREVMSEPGPDGGLSWGRVGSSVTLLASVYWISAVFIKTHHLDGVDFKSIAAYVTGPYAANKISTAIQSYSNKDTVGKP